MFQIIKENERIRKLESENNKLRLEKSQLEDALLELAQIISEAQDGQIVCTEDNE